MTVSATLAAAATALRAQLATVPGIQDVLHGLPQNDNVPFPLAWAVFRGMVRDGTGQKTLNAYQFDVRVAAALGDVASADKIDRATIAAAEAWIEQFTNTVPAAIDASVNGQQPGRLGLDNAICKVIDILSGEGPDGYVVIGGLLCRSVHFVVQVRTSAPFGSGAI